MMNVKAKACLSILVYRSLTESWKTLTRPELKNLPQVKSLIAACQNAGIVEVKNDEVIPITLETPKRNYGASPFVVLEGMDGAGKTTLTKHLSMKLNMTRMVTPPKADSFQDSRAFFDEQKESVRRAYYSIGNYWAAKEVIDSSEPVVMDRYWHSTAAYAFAHYLKTDNANFEELSEKSDFIWPSDLLKPDLVVFLTVSEEERIRRHKNRRNFTNTDEEQTLAADSVFRQNLVRCYQEIIGPTFVQLEINGEKSDSEQKIIKCVTEHFPQLSRSKLDT